MDGYWHPPEPAPFSGEYNDHAPEFSGDGTRIYFSSDRPGGIENCKSIWYVRKNGRDLGEPRHLGKSINDGLTMSFARATRDGKYLFFSRFDGDDENSTDVFYWVEARVLDPHLIRP